MISAPLPGATATAGAEIEPPDPRVHARPGAGEPPGATDTIAPTAFRTAALAAVSGRALPAAPRPKPSSAGYASSAAALKTTTAKATAAKTTTAKTTTASPFTATKTELSFLDDKKLSVEDKLMRFIALVSKQADDDIVAKMKEIEGQQAASKTTTGSSSGSTATAAPKKKGFLGGVLDAVKTVAAPVLGLLDNKVVADLAKQVTGPVLAAGATVLGFPEAAPVLLKAGPEVVKLLQGVPSALDGLFGSGGGSSSATSGATGLTASSSSATSSSSSSSTSSSATAENEQLQMMELQRMMEKEKEMMTAISNTLKALHDMRMNTLQNIR